MAFKLTVGGKDISKIAGDLQWSDSVDTLGMELSFSLPFDRTGKQFPEATIRDGSKVTLRYKSKVIFYGMVVEIEHDGIQPKKYTCFDFAFLLNKSDMTIQFNSKPADQCLKDICKKFGIKHTVTSIPVKIKKVFKAQAVSEIMNEILEIASKSTGKKYRFEMRGNTLVVFEWNRIIVKINNKWLESAQRTESIVERKNSITVESSDEKKYKVFAKVSSKSSIKYHGLLHKTEQIDSKEKTQAKRVADNLLKQLNRVQEEGSISTLGNYEARAGRVLDVIELNSGFNGRYSILSSSHSLSNGIHMMQLDLKAV